MKETYSQFQTLLEKTSSIVVLQADNPDGDSLGSALALEAILHEMGKGVHLVCAVDMPAHLKYLSGWDRVVKDVPQDFDLTIIVDSSSESLFDVASSKQNFSWIKTKPVVVIDHHTTTNGVSFANISIIKEAVSTGEILHDIALELSLPLPLDGCEMIAISILSDSMGLTTDATTAHTFRVMADLVERGVDLAKIDASRRELMKKEPELLPYKGELLQRVRFALDGKLASIDIPWREIEKYSPLYNPTMLVLDDMRLTVGVCVAIGFKIYADGKITAKIRANYGYPIAAHIAKKFGGGGHPYAAGFKILDGRSIEDIRHEVEKYTENALARLGESHETL